MTEFISKQLADKALDDAIASVERRIGMCPGAYRSVPTDTQLAYMPLIIAHMELQARVSHTIMLETQVGRVLAAAAASQST